MSVGEELKEILGEKLVEYEVLRPHTSMQVGGVADYYYAAESVDEIKLAVEAAVKVEIPYFVLGAGSNVIVSDFGYPGLVIANKTANLNFLLDRAQAIVDSGVLLAHLVTKATERELGGIEFLIGVPGTVGGAVYNNASCWGGAISEYVRSVTLLMPPRHKDSEAHIVNIGAEKLNFGYHTSWLKELAKREPDRKPIVLTVLIQLSHLRREEIMRRIREYQEKRTATQPVGELSAGCIFKNPTGEASYQNKFSAGQASSGVTEEIKDNLSAGYLIDKAGGKRLKIGGARVSKKHANFIINTGKATAREIRTLIEDVKHLVLDKHGIALEEEIEYLGQEKMESSEGEL